MEGPQVADARLFLDDQDPPTYPGITPSRRPTALPGAGLADLEDPGAALWEAAPARFGEHAHGWLAERLLGEVEGAPVDADEDGRTEILEGLHRFLGRAVDELHDGRRPVGADGEGGDV